jgi:small-conductance mechanosensitive channel/CRP-like cAMP-binding protein
MGVMPLAQLLSKYATTAGALVVLVGLAAARLASRNAHFKRDMRVAQLYLLAFVGLELARKLFPSDWVNVDKSVYVVGLLLFTFGTIHGAAGALFQYRRSRTGVETPRILRDLVDGLLFIMAVMLILQSTLNINLSALLASSAVISLVLGLALQETLGNLFAGLSLQAERPFAEGDWIRIGPHSGRVTEIGWRATTIKNGAGEVVTLPNSGVAKEAIYNVTRGGASLRKIPIGMGYDIPPNGFKEMMLEMMRAHSKVLTEPGPVVRNVDFGASTIGYELQFWVTHFEDGLGVEEEIRTQLWYRLRRAGIEVPFPSTHVAMTQRAPPPAMPGGVDVPGLLSKVDFLAGVPEPLRKDLARRTGIAHFGQGETIIRQGDAETGPFYVIAEGEVLVRVRSPGHEEEEDLARLRPGDYFGEMAVLTGEPRSASVVALGDVTLVTMDREAFAELFAREPNAAHALAEVLAQRREGLSRAMAASSAHPPSPPQHPSQFLEKLRRIFRQL